MFSRVLIANRGAIACRIIRTLRRMGVSPVAVYSDADRHAAHVAQADVAVRLGPPPAVESYLQQDAIIDAALRTGAQAIHPGYGFLSENAGFVEACERVGLVFLGPTPRNERVASSAMNEPSEMVSTTIIGASAFGRMCLSKIRASPAPRIRAAGT